MNKIVIAGGSGFVGEALADHFLAKGNEVAVLSRSPRSEGSVRQVVWDGKTVGDWASELDSAKAVINLSGVSITKRWTEENRKLIISSRVESTKAIGEAIAKSRVPPTVWVNASATGIYGDRGEELLTEDSAPGPVTEFMPECCLAWEEAVTKAAPKCRELRMRIGPVLGHGSGAYDALAKLTRFFLGGQVGDGRQFFSWIHVHDLVALFDFAIESDLHGPVNTVAPKPVTNGELMATFRRVFHRPWSPPAPGFALKAFTALGGIETQPVMISQRVECQTVRHAGFQFKFADVESAIRDLHG